jgi:hypothetical protein
MMPRACFDVYSLPLNQDCQIVTAESLEIPGDPHYKMYTDHPTLTDSNGHPRTKGKGLMRALILATFGFKSISNRLNSKLSPLGKSKMAAR